MKKIIKEEMVAIKVKKEVAFFKTTDGKEFRDKAVAKKHEELIKKYPKIGTDDIEWMEGFVEEKHWEQVIDNFEKALRSDKVIVLLIHSGGDGFEFEVVEPHLVAVQAVIKALNRRVVGCNYNMYVDGIIYKCESLSFDDVEKEDGSYYQTGSGRNIKDVLP
jgi:hypothetical protein